MDQKKEKGKLLFYSWGAYNEAALEKVLREKQIPYCIFCRRLQDYHADADFANEFLKILHREQVQAVFSYDYFPLVSMICEMNQIPYLSWIYDSPMYPLYSKTIVNERNYIFCFDRKYSEYLKKMGAKHCFHFPLAADAGNLTAVKSRETEQIKEKYACDISFVGNLYNEKKNRLRDARLSEYSKGYLEGVIGAQLKVYGYNFIREILSPQIVDEIAEKCQLTLSDLYVQDKTQMAADAVGMEVSAREREMVLKNLGSYFHVHLYSGSAIPDSLQGLKIQEKGFADYQKEMPYIFHNSRINLNITSKTIETGIPLRVFDILSCGGFCMTNYQEEIAEYFVDGEDLVMYTSMEDLVYKTAYYLEHEEERKKIACSGYEKLRQNHDLPVIFQTMYDGIMA